MALDLNYDDEQVKQAAKEAEEKASGNSSNYGNKLKLEATKTYLLILPGNGKNLPYKETFHYEYGSGKTFRQYASAASINDYDDVGKMRNVLYNKYGEKIKDEKGSAQAKLADALRLKKAFYVNAIKLKKKKSGWSVDEIGYVALPAMAQEAFLSRLGEHGSTGTCHPDKGRILLIEANGKSGFGPNGRRYKTAYFEEGEANLLEDEVVEIEEIEAGFVDLAVHQKKYSEKSINEFMAILKKKFGKLMDRLEESDDFDSDDEDDDGLGDLEDESGSDDLSLDDGEESDDDLDDDLDDISDDLDDDLDDLDDLDDDFAEEEVVDVEALKKEYNAKAKQFKKKKTKELRDELVALRDKIKENS